MTVYAVYAVGTALIALTALPPAAATAGGRRVAGSGAFPWSVLVLPVPVTVTVVISRAGFPARRPGVAPRPAPPSADRATPAAPA